jgi:hypothetical protein
MADFKLLKQSALKKVGITFSEYLSLMLILYNPGVIISIDLSHLLENNYIEELREGYVMTTYGNDVIKELDLLSVSSKISDSDIRSLAEKLREVFPKGKKEGTNKYWRDSVSNVAKKLSNFYKEYGYFDDEVILNAATKYVASFGNNRQLMRILPYFLEKEGSSELATIIENIDSVETDSNNDVWASVLV